MHFTGEIITRFAPSPSGPMHVGHLLAVLQARHLADVNGGRCLLRIEDIDQRSCSAQWIDLLYKDLAWLGISFDGDVMIQSHRYHVYAKVLEQLRQIGVLYPCFCTRGEIKAQLAEMGRAPHAALGYLYPGTCRSLSPEEVASKMVAGIPHAWRINMQRVQDLIGCPCWEDMRRGVQRCVPTHYGDVVLARKDMPTSYHLAVVVDDAEQGVSLVSRGEDLFEATHIHRALQGVLGLPVPQYYHHPLLRDNLGKRLAKRDGARSLASLRENGYTPAMIRESLLSALSHGGIWQM